MLYTKYVDCATDDDFTAAKLVPSTALRPKTVTVFNCTCPIRHTRSFAHGLLVLYSLSRARALSLSSPHPPCPFIPHNPQAASISGPPGIGGRWVPCSDCAPLKYPCCTDCVRIDRAAAYATVAEREAAKAASVREIADAKRNYTKAMDEKNKTVAPASWSGSEFPPGPTGPGTEPFGGGDVVNVALQFAEMCGLKASILTARDAVAANIFTLQCLLCTAVGDSRTAEEGTGLLPPGHPSWYVYIYVRLNLVCVF